MPARIRGALHYSTICAYPLLLTKEKKFFPYLGEISGNKTTHMIVLCR